MRGRTFTALVTLTLLATSVSPAAADGWRSHSRRSMDRDAEPVVVEEEWPHDHGGDGRDHSDPLDGRNHLSGRVDRQQPLGTTQPYWGTMRPYWGSNEPPGVIHRQPRTQPLKIPKK